MKNIKNKVTRKTILEFIEYRIELFTQIIDELQPFDTPCMYDEVTELAGLVNYMWELKILSFKERCDYLNALYPLGDKAKEYDKNWVNL